MNTSLNYWQQRMRRIQDKKDENAEDMRRDLEKIHKHYMKEIQDEIDGFYTRYAYKEGVSKLEAIKKAKNMDVVAFQNKAARYVKEKDFSDKANEELRLYNLKMKVSRLELLKMNIDLELIALANEEEAYIKEMKMKAHRDEMIRQAGIMGNSAPSREKIRKYADSVVNKPYHNKDFSQRIWSGNADLRQYLKQHLSAHVARGRNPREFAKRLRKVFGKSEYEAERLAITEQALMQSYAREQSFHENGVERYDIFPESDACATCKAIAETGPYRVDELRQGINASPFHPFCKCTEVPVSFFAQVPICVNS